MQKYPQAVVSTRIVPGCVQFWGRKNVFTQSGPLSEVDHRGVRNTLTIESELLVTLELPPSSSLLHGQTANWDRAVNN
jgi:hypothetical protein